MLQEMAVICAYLPRGILALDARSPYRVHRERFEKQPRGK